MADPEILDGSWGSPPQRDLRTMSDVTPGAAPAVALGPSRVCLHGFAGCAWADAPAHLHREGAIVAPCCSWCGRLERPFDPLTGRCPACAQAGR